MSTVDTVSMPAREQRCHTPNAEEAELSYGSGVVPIPNTRTRVGRGKGSGGRGQHGTARTAATA